MILPFDKTKELFEQYGLEVTEKQYENLKIYAELLVDWNEKINLTAITDPEGITVKHFLDSLLIFKYAEIGKNSSFIDVGTGAGFPGIPMKIYRNDLECTLLDSLNKRVNFLKEVSEKTGLPMNCIHSRAEEGGKNKELREKFDISTARAVAALPVLCEYCMPFVKVGGSFVALKAKDGEAELKEAENGIKLFGGETEAFEKRALFESDGSESQRAVIVVKKISPTPDKFPRAYAKIAKKPM